MLYKYRALQGNKIITQKIEADNIDTVISYLKRNGLTPIEITKVQATSQSLALLNRVTFTDIVDLTRQLAIMLNAGLTLIDSFDIMKKQITKIPLLSVIESLDKEIRAGETLSSALKKYPQHFSNLYIALVKSGEASGKLSEILL